MKNLKRPSWRELRSDLSGGLAGALVSIPQSMGMGIVAFAPFGGDFASLGLVAGLLGGVVVTTCSALFGGTPGLISGPRGSVSLVFAAIITNLLAAEPLFASGANKAAMALSFAMIALMAAGALQIAFGLCRFGNAIKFVPYPVIAGFLNAAAILIVLGQIRIVFNLPAAESFLELGRYADTNSLARAGLVITTAAAIFAVSKLFSRVPGLLPGAVVGAGIYYAILASGVNVDLGPTLPGVQSIALEPRPLGDLFGLLAAGWDTLFGGAGAVTFDGFRLRSDTVALVVTILVPGAISIALLQSFDSLFSAVALDDLTQSHSDGKRELIAQGGGTVLSAGFGFLGGSGSMVRTMPCYLAGGRTAWAGLASSVFILVAVLLFAPVVKGIPTVVIAGILLVIAIELFDKWTLALLKNLRTNGLAVHRAVAVDLSIIGLVVGTGLVFGLVEAVGVGMVVATVAFVLSVGRSPIRRSYRGNAVSAFLQRGGFSAALLREYGNLIVVLELEGPLFFGSIGKIEREVSRLADQGLRHVILDLKRVSTIDSTASRALTRIHKRLEKRGKTLSISYLMTETRRRQNVADRGEFRRHPSATYTNWQKLHQFGALDAIGGNRFFPDTDMAMRHCEMLLIEEIGDSPVADVPQFTALLDELTDDELDTIRSFSEECSFTAGSTVFEQGDPGDTLYIVLDGMVDALIDHVEAGRSIRVNTMTKGAVFGEMAILDPQPRSATIVATEDTICYRISARQLECLNALNPALGLRMMKYMCLLFTTRLRMANLAILELES